MRLHTRASFTHRRTFVRRVHLDALAHGGDIFGTARVRKFYAHASDSSWLRIALRVCVFHVRRVAIQIHAPQSSASVYVCCLSAAHRNVVNTHIQHAHTHTYTHLNLIMPQHRELIDRFMWCDKTPMQQTDVQTMLCCVHTVK